MLPPLTNPLLDDNRNPEIRTDIIPITSNSLPREHHELPAIAFYETRRQRRRDEIPSDLNDRREIMRNYSNDDNER